MTSILWVLVVVLLILAIVGALPGLHSYGYAPSGVVTVIVIILLVLLLTGRL